MSQRQKNTRHRPEPVDLPPAATFRQDKKKRLDFGRGGHMIPFSINDRRSKTFKLMKEDVARQFHADSNYKNAVKMPQLLEHSQLPSKPLTSTVNKWFQAFGIHLPTLYR